MKMKSFEIFVVTVCSIATTTTAFLLHTKDDVMMKQSSHLWKVGKTIELGLSSSAAINPPVEREEIERILEEIPVYALSSKLSDSIVFINERNKNIANFFLSKEIAENVASSYGSSENVQVDSYSLGRIYFQFFDSSSSLDSDVQVLMNNEQEIEYRLIPDPREIEQAQTILSQMMGGDGSSSQFFTAKYNDIPLFMDQRLRLSSPTTKEAICPIYFAWNDLMTTCQEYVGAYEQSQQGDYQAAISVSNLSQLVEQMKQPSAVDFGIVEFVPASPNPLEEE